MKYAHFAETVLESNDLIRVLAPNAIRPIEDWCRRVLYPTTR